MTTQSVSYQSLADRGARTGGDIVRQILVIISLAAVITVNGLANALAINGQATGDISDRFEVFFVPAGYVFSIWGLIYVTLIGYAVYQALPAQATNPIQRNIGYLFVLSSLFNIAWIFLWHYEFFAWTLVMMSGLLLTLIAIYVRIGSGFRPASKAEYWLLHFPFSLYLGWITVATVANATSLLDYLNWSGWGIAPELWAVIMLVVAGLVGAAVGVLRGDIAYVGVLVWAFAGIAVKHWDTPLVAYSALAMIAVIVVALVIGVPRRLRRLGAMAPAPTAGSPSSPSSI
jgi:benzodiazapine receptor